jgi:hypothetical protein
MCTLCQLRGVIGMVAITSLSVRRASHPSYGLGSFSWAQVAPDAPAASPSTPPARSLPKATTCAALLTLCPAGRAPRGSRALPAPGRLWGSSVFASSPSLPEDQVPPLLPLQLRPPPPPSCMTQQNRSCRSESKPSAQEAPQPRLARDGRRGRQRVPAQPESWPHFALHTPSQPRGTK